MNNSPSYKIKENKKMNILELGNLNDKSKIDKDNKLKKELGLLKINIKNPILKFKKNESNSQLNNKKNFIKNRNEKNIFYISDNNISASNTNSYKNILESGIRKNNYLNIDKDHFKNKLFKIKIKNKDNINIPRQKLYFFDKTTNDNIQQNTFKAFFNKQINKTNNIKLILDIKNKDNKEELKEDKKRI